MIFPSIKIVESVLPENGPVVPDKSVLPALLPSHFRNMTGGIQYRNNLLSVLPANYPVVPAKCFDWAVATTGAIATNLQRNC